jgi:hypothetical protein
MWRMEDKAEKKAYYKIPSRTVRELYERFQDAHLVHRRDDRLRSADRVLSAEAMLNALVLRFLDLPEAEQRAILLEYVPVFQRLREADEARAGAPDPLAGATRTRSVADPDPAPKGKPKRA